ncbi:unnamed protein product [Penicillium olsonii]|uniref:Zn(2)-C6 fungal-type domain-containing protein n=1 Tax=Penicillium olsonii TaxID=99116 RepID=A0A9W4HMF3_PENOL|nr:unnamed protein product [Penicillium olsonii]
MLRPITIFTTRRLGGALLANFAFLKTPNCLQRSTSHRSHFSMPRNSPATKVACTLCHGRRVKCDRSDDVACSNCQIAQRDCDPIISRRGRKRKLPLVLSESVSKKISPQSSHSLTHGAVPSSKRPPVTAAADDGEPGQRPCFPALDPGGKTPYVGDSSNLNYLVQQFGNPFDGTTDTRPLQDRLQGAMLARLGQSTAQEIEQSRISNITRLRAEGAFNSPDPETSQALLDSYFQNSFAALPILDRSRFLAQLEEGSASQLLLNAVYLTGTVYCSDLTVLGAGFASRYSASLTFYQRAKSIYDAGLEPDTITMIQATFLMCHWWSGLLEQKDPWHWIGISVGMAQALGLHQAKSYIRLGDTDRKLWRRLWWMIYAMDINLSMFLDRPPRVQGRLCNVPPLTEADFETGDNPKNSGDSVEQSYASGDFLVKTVQLARIDTLDLRVTGSSSHWMTRTYRLVLHRSNPRFSGNTGPGTPIYDICTDIYHMLEILLAKDLINATAGNIIASVLSLLSIQVLNIHKGESGVRMISEHRARFCMMILESLQDRLPILAAFLPIYESLLKSSHTGQRLGREKVQECPPEQTIQPEACNAETGIQHNLLNTTEGLFDQVPQDSLGTMFPFSFPFGNLFEDVIFG